MTTFDARSSIDQGLQHLASRLNPIIGTTLAPSLGGLPWPTVLTELDRMRGKPPKLYYAADLQAQLKVLTERLGSLGYPFDDHTRLVSALGSELRIVRNRWAHHDELTTLDAWRAHDFAVRLLEKFRDTQGIPNADRLREEAFNSLAEEKGVAAHISSSASSVEAAPEPSSEDLSAEVVRPDPSVLIRPDAAATPTIGAGRDEFQPWTVVFVGEVAVLDDLPKKVSKEKVRAVASEIVEFEGPIHIDRLARLTAASFDVQRLRSTRMKKLTYQIRQIGLLVDEDKFVWPADLDPATWSEFRPNASTVERDLTEISPVEIANAMRLLAASGALSNTELDAATLTTFGRKRKTTRFANHLSRARALL